MALGQYVTVGSVAPSECTEFVGRAVVLVLENSGFVCCKLQSLGGSQVVWW